jgi:pantoate--beta-alanine ligase
MLTLTSPEEMFQWRKTLGDKGISIGFVPTMGFLHEGHTSLIRKSTQENTHTVVSIFVNPTQFTNSEDFEKYPQDKDGDSSLLRALNVDVLYSPSPSAVYPEGFNTSISAGHIATKLEGKSRPGHFDGVATVVVKLLNAVNPHNAYFGKKDRQQLAVIQQVVRDLNLPVNIVGQDTVRDHDGVALSSRNSRLTDTERKAAAVLPQTLRAMITAFHAGVTSSAQLVTLGLQVLASEPLCNVDYVAIVNPNTMEEVESPTNASVICIAATFGSIRLIDNTEMSNLV